MSRATGDDYVAFQLAKRAPPTKFNKIPAAAMVARNRQLGKAAVHPHRRSEESRDD
jgi:hypothetical protein